MTAHRRQAKGSAVIRPRLAHIDYEGSHPALLDPQSRHYGDEDLYSETLSAGLQAIASRIVNRVGRSLVGLFFVGLVVVGALPALTHARHMIARYFGDRAEMSYQAGDFGRSKAFWKRSIEIEPAEPNSHYELARAYERLGEDTEALKEYQRSIDMKSQLYDAYIAAAEINITKRKDYDSALKYIVQALRQNPDDFRTQSSLYVELARADIGLARWDRAQRNLVHAVQLDSARGSAHCLLAQVLEEQSKSDWATSEWGFCAAFSNQAEVGPRWRAEADERLSRDMLR